MKKTVKLSLIILGSVLALLILAFAALKIFEYFDDKKREEMYSGWHTVSLNTDNSIMLPENWSISEDKITDADGNVKFVRVNSKGSTQIDNAEYAFDIETSSVFSNSAMYGTGSLTSDSDEFDRCYVQFCYDDNDEFSAKYVAVDDTIDEEMAEKIAYSFAA